jgi:hypothetical protein
MGEEKQEKDKWLDAVTRMIELTQQGKLKWTAESSASTPNDDDRMSAVFTTHYKNKKIRLYAVRVSLKPNDLVISTFNRAIGQDPPKWRKKVILEFVNMEGFPLWTFPAIAALFDLLNAVQYQVAGVNEFLDDIFNEPETVAS